MSIPSLAGSNLGEVRERDAVARARHIAFMMNVILSEAKNLAAFARAARSLASSG
jgi:hypothetical protein